MSSSPNIEQAKSHCITLLTQTLPSLPSRKISPSSKLTLHRLLSSELRFLLSHPHRNPSSLNLGYLDSLLLSLLHPSVLHVSRVSSGHVTCTFSRFPAWLLVSDRNPDYILWARLRLRLLNTLSSARSAAAPLKPSLILLLFRRGLPLGDGDSLAHNLVREFAAAEIEFSGFHRAFQISVQLESGEKNCAVGVLKGMGMEIGEERDNSLGDDEFGRLVSAMRVGGGEEEEVEFVNFDTTALVAVVSGISNGGGKRLLEAPEDEMRARFKSNYEFVIGQVVTEPLVMF